MKVNLEFYWQTFLEKNVVNVDEIPENVLGAMKSSMYKGMLDILFILGILTSVFDEVSDKDKEIIDSVLAQISEHADNDTKRALENG